MRSSCLQQWERQLPTFSRSAAQVLAEVLHVCCGVQAFAIVVWATPSPSS